MRRTIFVLVFALVAVPSLLARDTRKELTVNLKFSPQEGVDSEAPDLPAAMLEQTVDVRAEDGRGGEDALVIGKGTNDDDESFPIRAKGDVIEHVGGVLQKVASGWGLKTGEAGDRILKVKVVRFDVEESNKAVGSMYAANVKLSAVLTDRAGKKLAEASGSGEANRYGRARSGDNCSEVLSDATKEAFANVLSDTELQSAWTSGKSSAKAGKEKESVEERLRKLDELLRKKLITKEEYDKKRAEILKDV
jgi:hypothetical protein